jgi:hypothetical protein
MRNINPRTWNDLAEPMLRAEGLGGLLALLFLLLVVVELFSAS